ncbi:MAG: hypothetical protein JSS22_05365 [Proteobacteria bacterium]|nr:hypothetical protein [Pseudomonadota bacterium]
MDASTQDIGCLGIDRSKPDQAAKGCLHVTARAAKPIVQIEMAKGGVQVIAPHQDNHATAEPDAFRVSSGTVDGVLSFNEFVGFALAVLGGVSRSSRVGCRRFCLILGAKIAALCNRSTNAEQQREPGDGKTTENRFLEPKQHSTHKVPDSCCPQAVPPYQDV